MMPVTPENTTPKTVKKSTWIIISSTFDLIAANLSIRVGAVCLITTVPIVLPEKLNPRRVVVREAFKDSNMAVIE